MSIQKRPRGFTETAVLMSLTNALGWLIVDWSKPHAAMVFSLFTIFIVAGYVVIWFYWQGRNTRIALLVLLLTAAFFMVLGRFWYPVAVNHANESVLKRDLQTMREAIDNYTHDQEHPPQSLQTLVDEKYLRMIPVNPFTRRADWVPHYVNAAPAGEASIVGIDDVHASAPYSDW